MTTKSKHLNEIWRAIRSHAVAFRVPYVGADGGQAPRMGYVRSEAWPLECAANVTHLVNEYRKLCGTLKRALSVYYESQTALAARLESEAGVVRAYCDAFALDCPELDPADDARVIWRTHELRAAKFSAPGAAEKREREQARRLERKAAKEAAERAERHVYETALRAAWRAGSNVNHYRLSDERGGALLRYDAADDRVRTSHGAEIPAADARAAFPLIARVRDRSENLVMPWGNQAKVKLGAFALNEIRADGTIRAGCHIIYWPEIEALARALGLVS